MPNRAIAWTSSPVVMAPVDTRHAPTASSAMVPSDGSSSSAGSNVARSRATCSRAPRRDVGRGLRIRPTSRCSSPRVLTTSAPSNDSWATVATSPRWAWVRAAGVSTRRL